MIDYFLFDRGGRRKIKDRRFRVAARHALGQRTGLKRRGGWDRRFQQIQVFKGINRRIEMTLDSDKIESSPYFFI